MTFQLGRSYQAAGRDEDAASLYREAAEAGQSVAQYELALAFYDGRGVAQDPRQAVEWLEKSSSQGNGFAKYFLGIEKVNGTYVPQDYPGAYVMFEEAAAFGVPEALVELGKMAYSGQGVAEDYAKANPPESLRFDPVVFQELADGASQIYQSVASEDGTPEKLEAARHFEAFLAFTLQVDRDRFTR